MTATAGVIEAIFDWPRTTTESTTAQPRVGAFKCPQAVTKTRTPLKSRGLPYGPKSGLVRSAPDIGSKAFALTPVARLLMITEVQAPMEFLEKGAAAA